jgi:hypothetical protein
MTAPLRLELFGLRVRLEHSGLEPCCSASIAVIETCSGPEFAKLTCETCGRNRGWLSKPTAMWLTAVINKFGAPTTPIVLRRGHTSFAHSSEEIAGNAGTTQKEMCK